MVADSPIGITHLDEYAPPSQSSGDDHANQHHHSLQAAARLAADDLDRGVAGVGLRVDHGAGAGGGRCADGDPVHGAHFAAALQHHVCGERAGAGVAG